VGKPDEKDGLVDRRKWEDNIEVDLQELVERRNGLD
jgi:hypothetical protein